MKLTEPQAFNAVTAAIRDYLYVSDIEDEDTTDTIEEQVMDLLMELTDPQTKSVHTEGIDTNSTETTLRKFIVSYRTWEKPTRSLKLDVEAKSHQEAGKMTEVYIRAAGLTPKSIGPAHELST